ncbi:MAG: hypothetical protein PHP59_10945 [Methanofollis sp.]|uniref:hypothetical protein n=1 Tax=Methanofollis sp. TaxID=2052835 RepID=UPI0026338441|nr:hypothetical protein [Methanofollis sp.]MDD4255876.1 hypothetical protein [Methanofollis sp.]
MARGDPLCPVEGCPGDLRTGTGEDVLPDMPEITIEDCGLEQEDGRVHAPSLF